MRGTSSLARVDNISPRPIALGDPGILAPALLDRTPRKKYVLGMIPHYRDASSPAVEQIRSLGASVRIIDVGWTPEEVATEIASCDAIISSSLHGLIFSDALGVPNAHIPLGGKLTGGLYKFHDYYSAYPGESRYRQYTVPAGGPTSVESVVAAVVDGYAEPVGHSDLQDGLVRAWEALEADPCARGDVGPRASACSPPGPRAILADPYRPGGAHLIVTDSASTTGPAVAGPLVSMVVPVYNTVTYLAETLESLLDQGLSESELEVVMVDDGSDDGSETMVDEYAARYPNFRAIHQEQSGGPASPCNEGIWASRGTYFFVLGADDVMAPRALRELVDVAEREGSDVVLAKLGSLGGRRTPDSVYTKTVLDADLVEHKIFNTLAAVKLFRRELRGRHRRLPSPSPPGGIRPAVRGRAVPRRERSSPSAPTASTSSSAGAPTAPTSHGRSARRSSTSISPVQSSRRSSGGPTPGPLRDGVVRRTFRREIPQIVGRAFLDLPDAEQRVLADRVRAMLAPVLNDATSRHLDPLTRTKIELLIEDDLEALRGVIEWETSTKNVQVRHDGAAFSYALPAGSSPRRSDRRGCMHRRCAAGPRSGASPARTPMSRSRPRRSRSAARQQPPRPFCAYATDRPSTRSTSRPSG